MKQNLLIIAGAASAHEDPRWTAVATRDAAADGNFVFAVKTTGVYCRPSCASRQPRRENVVFYRAPEAAEAAGYRACKRCRPKDTRESDPALQKVRRASALIDKALLEDESGPPALASLAAEVSTSPHHLLRLFKKHLGITPHEYADARRLELVKRHLRAGEGVSGALYAAGYGSPSRLYERSNAQLGMTPATYRRDGKGATIEFTTVRSPLGRLMVAATVRGLAAVSLGDDDAGLERWLRAEYPAAEIRRATGRLEPWVTAILEHLAGERPNLALPLDLQATAFQWQVWRALQKIPYGRTATYSEIAQAIGRPKAVRAVANACASNRAALVIPCHRVVRGDGDAGGYRWGTERKERILAKERSAAKTRRVG
ncbi:MAG TPA: bifunctional DNA-binding transcriptional regulator/O6-methylguanine-DNA methyltransferase Ada [Stellaceae bacterium]|jgi:AraC family transcriptional regulator of adaptative response/methylated-DNA-[protein]-cysteine methyltransferase|nr:bifunctional DNA-binding transcriptional regulator/O6-methylguanine-DNA methyltransferase Ada [Stellaceae bacterium]